MKFKIAEECSQLSDNEQITFPEVVKRLMDAGIDSYYVDLVAHTKIFYADNQSYSVKGQHHPAPIADNFSAQDVVAAIRQIQQGAIKYQTFLKKIMEAGTLSYHVFIKGRKAMYLGKKGEMHIEEFPK